MELKIFMMKNGIRSVDISKNLEISPSLISLHLNGIKKLPDPYIPNFCNFLGIDLLEFLNGNITVITKESV